MIHGSKSVYVMSSINLFSNFNYTKFVMFEEICEILYCHTIETIQRRKRNVSEKKDFLKNMFKGAHGVEPRTSRSAVECSTTEVYLLWCKRYISVFMSMKYESNDVDVTNRCILFPITSYCLQFLNDMKVCVNHWEKVIYCINLEKNQNSLINITKIFRNYI